MNILLIPIYIVLIIFSILIFFYFVPIGLWFTAIISYVDITLLEIIGMRLRKSPVKEIVFGLIKLNKAEIKIKKSDLESFGRAGGNIENVTNGLITAKNAGFQLTFEEATKADFSGINIIDAVNNKIESKTKTTLNN